MTEICVEYPKSKSLYKDPLTKLWYDAKKKKMLSFIAHRLEFERQYDEELEEYRILPKPIVNEKEESQDAEDIIKSWYAKYTNNNKSNSQFKSKTNAGIVFEVPDNEVEDFAYDLERNKLKKSIR